MGSLNVITNYNLNQIYTSNKLRKDKYTIPYIISLLNLIIEHNQLDCQLQEHNKLQNKANVIIRKKQLKQQLA